MAKNLAARARPAQRRHGKYALLGKEPYKYHDIGRPLDRGTLTELHAARVEAYGRGYAHEQDDLARAAAARVRDR